MNRSQEIVASDEIRIDPVKTRLLNAAGPCLIAIVFVLLSAWSWRKWPDLLVDFSRELYVAWALSTGKTLYVDVAYFNGPLSPYLNALWFRLFGVSLTTLIFCNLSLLAITTGLIYKIFSIASDRLTAALVTIVFLCMFAFSQYTIFGSENYVCPYSHEATHGTLLALAVIFCLMKYAVTQKPCLIICAGIFLGMAFLTKAEIFAAALSALLVGMFLIILNRQPGNRRIGMDLSTFLLSAAMPIAAFFLFLIDQMPAREAVRGVCGAWAAMVESKILGHPFYQTMMGFDQPRARLLTMIFNFAGVMMLILFAVWADRVSSKLKEGRNFFVFLACAALLICLLAYSKSLPVDLIEKPLPVVNLMICLTITPICLKARRQPATLMKWTPWAMWSTFSFVMLGKMILNPVLSQYGFFLAMPSFLLAIACLVHLIPNMLARFYGSGNMFRWLFVSAAVGLMSVHIMETNEWYRQKNFAVGRNGDVLLTYGPQLDPAGYAVEQTLQQIESWIPKTASLAVLPEGAILNYLSGRWNSTPFVELMPTAMEIFGEGNILSAFETHPPDFIILVHKDTLEYGAGYFGGDDRYGKNLMDWINTRYRLQNLILNEPFVDDRFGIKILKRVDRVKG